MRRIPAVALVVSLLGCAAPDMSKNKTAGAVAAAGFGVAAAGVYRAATGACWAQCYPGQQCDHASGMCVPIEASAKPVKKAPSASIATPVDDAQCRGLCFARERCVIRDGAAECELVDAGAAPTQPK